MKQILKRLIPEALRSKGGLAIIVTAAVLVEVTSAVQYFFAREGIREEVERRAQSELWAKSLEIRNVMTAVEVAIGNMAWAVEAELSRPDSITNVTRRLVEQNEQIVGVSLGFVANYYADKGRWYEPYVAERSDGSIEVSQIGGASHDYLNTEWYSQGLAAGRGRWSDPYYDEAGAKMMLCSYTLPVRDSSGQIVALIGADVSLDWLSELINSRHVYPSSYNLLLSRTGLIMACPVESLVMKKNIMEVTSGLEDTTVSHVNRQMLAGNSGQATIRDEKGEKNYVFYAQMDGETGWSMAVVCSDREIFYSLRQVGFNLFVLMLVGLGLLAFIIWKASKNARRLMAVNAEKERIGNELHIASEIQKAMLPKTFPPYPDCDSIDIFGQLTPAKAVGGDLYDFYIREDKLFFCIGDVSGKGVPASLLMTVTRALFRTISAHETLPDRIVSQLSNTIAEDNELSMFVTLFVGVIDLTTGHMHYCNAGHDAPLLISKDGRQVGLLPVDSNIPAGVMKDWLFNRQDTTIDNGTTIFLYTDGLTEAEDIDSKQFGCQRLNDTAVAISANGRLLPRKLVEQMTAAVQAFVGEAEQSDDLTMMAILYDRKETVSHQSQQRSITLRNDIAMVPNLHDFINGVNDDAALDASMAMNVNLAVEEAVVNVMNYAYPKGTKGTVNIVSTFEDGWLQFVISDTGKPFDPTTHGNVDTTLPLEERAIGGLGIFLVQQIMDVISYERKDGKNILTVKKKVK